MKLSHKSAAAQAGAVGAIGFSAGWLFDPGASATLVVALVCGTASGLSQLANRDLISKAQGLVDRGADDSPYDGGILLDEAQQTRARLDKWIIWPIILGVLSPTTAALRTLIAWKGCSAAAFMFSALAIYISIQLFRANKELTKLLDLDRSRRALVKSAAQLEKDSHNFKKLTMAPDDLESFGVTAPPEIAKPNQH